MANSLHIKGLYEFRRWMELELELIQTQMTQKPMLRAEVYARALRASQNRKEDGYLGNRISQWHVARDRPPVRKFRPPVRKFRAV